MQIRSRDFLRMQNSRKRFSKNGTTFYCLLGAACSFKTLPLLGTSFLCPGRSKNVVNFENKRLILLWRDWELVKNAVYFQNSRNIKKARAQK